MVVNASLPVYVTVQDLIDRCKRARGNIFLLHNSYYSVPLGPSLAIIQSFARPLSPRSFHLSQKYPIFFYFYFFRLTNNVHDIFFFLIYVLTCGSRFLKANFLTHSALFYARRLKITALAAAARKYIYIIYAYIFSCIYMYVYIFIYNFVAFSLHTRAVSSRLVTQFLLENEIRLARRFPFLG